MFTTFLNSKLYNFYINLFNSKSDSILDPLTCLIRLAILEYKPLHTKLSINNNKITYNEPNLFQGPLRWSNGDNREDIHNIYNPIIKATEWYSTNNDDIQNIFLLSVKGLKKLKESYEPNSTISHSLEFYSEYIMKNMKQNNIKEETNTIFLQLKELWSEREINIINNLLLELEENENISFINAIEEILKTKEEIVRDIILNLTTKLE